MVVEHNGLQQGTEVARYQIVRELGAGSFGITYRARDLQRGFDVAIKEYLPRAIASRGAAGTVVLKSQEHDRFYQWGMDRFVTEAQILAQFRHANIVKVLNYFHANQTAYFVMEYQAGRDLDSVIRKLDQVMEEQQLRAWLVPVLSGLRTIHQKSYLHRDVKPGNIFLTRKGVPVLLDFGAACFAMGDEIRKTSDVLTPAYASLEQYGQESLGPWSDLYALGATVYRCLVKKAPISALKRADAVASGKGDPLIPAQKVGAAVASQTFLKVIDWMLAIQAVERPQSTDDVFSALSETIPRDSGERAGNSGRGGSVNERSHVSVARPEEEYKLVICGSKGSGKTTAVTTLGDLPAVTTEVWPGALGGKVRESTTTAMDYAYMDLGSKERLHLYGAPGEQRFGFMTEVLMRGAFGVVVLVDNRQAEVFATLEQILQAQVRFLARGHLVIGVTHMDLQRKPSIADYQEWMHSYCSNRWIAPVVFDVDARSAKDLKILLQALFYTCTTGHGENGRVPALA